MDRVAKRKKSARRPPGRPPARRPALSRARILKKALVLLERQGLGGFSMRGLARDLGVDPMALYHYFPDRESLLREAGLRYYRGFTVDFRGRRGWRGRVEALADAYLRFALEAVELIVFLTADCPGGTAAAALITPWFHEATRGLALSARRRQAFMFVLFDFLHGHALARGAAGAGEIWREELAVLMAGAAAPRLTRSR